MPKEESRNPIPNLPDTYFIYTQKTFLDLELPFFRLTGPFTYRVYGLHIYNCNPLV